MDTFERKIAVVTGAASGIGEALARRFAREGMQVVAADLDGVRLDETVGDSAAMTAVLDVVDEAATKQLVDKVEDQLGPIDLFCFNAGIATMGGVEVSDEMWQRTWEVNVMAHVYGLRAVLPSMLARNAGHLLHTASAAGLLTNIGAAPYSVTKHAVVALAEWVSMTYGDEGIAVSCLCPQFVETPMLDDLATTPGTQQWVRGVALGTDDVADAVLEGLRDETFLILPHPEVADYFRNKAEDYDRWLGGMRKLQRGLDLPMPDPGA